MGFTRNRPDFTEKSLYDIYGGDGSDTLWGGADWGNDTVEQLADGTVTLWFAEGPESSWNSETLTYSGGVNSVSVSGGVGVTLRFGAAPELPAGAFESERSGRIFEDKDKGFFA